MADKVPGIYRKLARVMSEVKRIPKNGVNTRFNYRFAQESDVADALRDAMTEHGVAFSVCVAGPPETKEMATNSGGTQYLTRVPLTLSYTDVEDGSTIEQTWWGEGMDTQDKSIAKACTSGTKYGLLKQFLIPTGDDPDADHNDDRPQTRQVNKETGEMTKPPATPQTPSGAKREFEKLAVALAGRGVPLKDDHTDPAHQYIKAKYGAESIKDLNEQQWAEFWRLANGVKGALLKAFAEAGIQVAA